MVLRISKLTDYAILVMVELCSSPGELLSAQALAERCGLELPTVSKVLKTLGRSGLVSSQRGASGGYRTEAAADGISVADVISAMEGPIAMTECSVHEGLCSVEANCSARDNWQRVSQAVASALQNISLADMSRPAEWVKGGAVGLSIATFNA